MDITFNIYGKYGNFENWAKADLWKEEDNSTKKRKREAAPAQTKRHKIIQNQELDQIESDRHEKNTKKSTAWAVSVLKDWLDEKESSLESFEKLDVNAQMHKLLVLRNGAHICRAGILSVKFFGTEEWLKSPP